VLVANLGFLASLGVASCVRGGAGFAAMPSGFADGGSVTDADGAEAAYRRGCARQRERGV